MSVKRKLAVLFVVEILLIGLFVIRDHGSYKVEPVEILTNHMENAGKSYRIRDIHQIFETKTSILNIDYGTLPSGTYKASVNYHAHKESQQTLRFDCSKNDYIKANEIILDYRLTAASFLITITHPVDDFTILLDYEGSGDISLDIQLYRSKTGMVRNCAAVLMIFTVLELAVFLYTKKQETFKIVSRLFAFACIAFLPYLLTGVYPGHDFDFHFMRIESIVNAVQSGQFPVYINPLWIGDYGFPVSAYYCDFFLNIPVLLRILGFSFDTAYKLFIFIINISTAFIAYLSFREIFKKKNIAEILAFVYVCAPYRLVDLYVRSSLGEICAYTFLPLVCAGFYGICTMDLSASSGEKRKYGLFLSLGMAGILLSHMLTVEMTVFILLILSVILWKKILSKQRIGMIFLSAISSLLISLFFLVPFVDFYLSNDTLIKHGIDSGIPSIQDNGMQIGELFLFFKDIFGAGGSDYVLKDRIYLSIGMVLTITLIIALIFIFKRQGTSKLKLFAGMACFCLFLSSNLFPWNSIAYYSKFGVIMSQIQFPWRFLSMTTVFATLTLGELLADYATKTIEKNIPNILFKSIAILVLFETIIISGNYSSSDEPRVKRYNTNEIELGAVWPREYLRYGANWTEFSNEISEENVSVDIKNRNGFHYDLFCETEEKDGIITMPLLNYKGYQVFDENGTIYPIADGPNKEIQFILPEGFQGDVTVEFQPFWYWKAAVLVSLLYFAFLVIYAAKNRKN